MKELELRHYGNNRFIKERFKPIADIPFRKKPSGGLWTSPVDSNYGWIDWNEMENFADVSTYFDITFRGEVFEINSVEDMNKLPWIESNGTWFISFEPLVFMGYDAIHLTDKGQEDTRLTYPKSLYGWDCETVLIMNELSIINHPSHQ